VAHRRRMVGAEGGGADALPQIVHADRPDHQHLERLLLYGVGELHHWVDDPLVLPQRVHSPKVGESGDG